MKHLCFIALFSAITAISSQAAIIPVVDSPTNLQLNFSLSNTAGQPPSVLQYETVQFPIPGSLFKFTFSVGSQQLMTPGSTDNFTVLSGPLNHSGSYQAGDYTINYALESHVSHSTPFVVFGVVCSEPDVWRGTFSATATKNRVPDGGTTLALLGLALGGLFFARRNLCAA